MIAFIFINSSRQLLYNVIASFGIGFKICFQEIWKEKEFENSKHDEEFQQNNNPYLFAPGHCRKPLIIEIENTPENVCRFIHFLIEAIYQTL